jgi:hypothetical protein
MKPRVIHILTFEGCPHADSAKAAARAAISECDAQIELVEVDLFDPTISAEYKGYPSPTILVGMNDVSPGQGSMTGIGCRSSGAPSVEEVRLAIRDTWGPTL